MRIVYVEIDHFRGIKKLRWAPSAGVNCLIGPGDSAKTTILDAIELVLNPRSYSFADDSDFYGLDYNTPVNIVLTVGELPPGFVSDDRYGLHLRGWNGVALKLEDEPGTGLDDVLSLRVTIDRSHEARWSLFNERIATDTESDPPALRYKDARQLASTRLGPYAERHLGWGRLSVLNRLEDNTETFSGQLADASRAARDAFTRGNPEIFKKTAARAEVLGKHFSVPVRERYVAELDVKGVSLTAGGVSLHDGKLPLRCLGTGSSRLIVSALQHGAGSSHVALIDEIEHGLEPHRIARLLKYLASSQSESEQASLPQMFITTHSPVVIRELKASDIFAVRSSNGLVQVRSVLTTARSPNDAQRHMRAVPDSFLARKIIVCEGRTEQGLTRGLDLYWSKDDKHESFALRGTTAVDGNGSGGAPILADHLSSLGYDVFLLLDSDEPVAPSILKALSLKGVLFHEWAGGCSVEERIFLDVPWAMVSSLIALAIESVTSDSVQAQINKMCRTQNLPEVTSLHFSPSLNTPAFRTVLGKAAKNDSRPWFKDISRGERVGELIGPCLEKVADTPLAQGLSALRKWIDE
ncbi:ATP-dependent nuclease [Bradyrhizobium sp. SZCCHNR1015]|uniref:ATP-dependent nuclease n=1 Tax=Bradyrhizobium sp. SZCCHNR1015 TaxID=3057338 RepID=UPI0029163F24|nr:AAA family ATPase [Bradyrhizobium sp. SZCCHNR1015]